MVVARFGGGHGREAKVIDMELWRCGAGSVHPLFPTRGVARGVALRVGGASGVLLPLAKARIRPPLSPITTMSLARCTGEVKLPLPAPKFCPATTLPLRMKRGEEELSGLAE